MAKQKAKGSEGNMRSTLAVVAAGLAAGYYFYASKDAEKHRKVASKWAKELKSDVLKQTKKLKKVDKKTLSGIVDGAAKAFSNARSNLDKKELAQAARELKANWDKIVREASAAKRSTAKKAVSRTAKKGSAKKSK